MNSLIGFLFLIGLLAACAGVPNQTQAETICNYLKGHAEAGKTVFYDIYSEEEKAADPAKKDTGLFFFKGNPGEKFAICSAGGGFAYVGAMGSPLYWHNICGLLRNLLDRCYGRVNEGEFTGKNLYFVLQGAAPEEWQLKACEFTMSRFARLYGFAYKGMVTNVRQAKAVAGK